MHYLFEIQLMTSEIVGEAPAEKRANYAAKFWGQALQLTALFLTIVKCKA